MKTRRVSKRCSIEAGTGVLQIQEAPHEQRRTHEEDQCHRDFEHHEPIAQPRPASALSGSARAIAQRFLEIQASGLKRRRQAEDEPGREPRRRRCRRCRAALISQ